MFAKSELLLQSIGVNLHGLDAAYLQVIDIIGAIRNCRHRYTKNDVDNVKLSIFWKTIREIGDLEINDGTEATNAAVCHILSDFPDESRKTDGRMWQPMHFAMSIPDIDLDEIQILYDNYPESISQGCDPEWNYTPCHLAMMTTDTNMDLIEMLKKFDPSFGVRQTIEDSTPLHLAAEFSNSISVIQELIREFPAALTMRDAYQRMPVACAFQNNSANALDIFRILLDAAPQTAREPDNKGRFLLHQCLNSGSKENLDSEEMVSITLEAFPDAVNIADNDGWLPIHLAALTCRRAEEFNMILEVNPAHLYANHPEWGTVAHVAVSGYSLWLSFDKLKYIHSIQPQLLLSLDQNHCTPLAIAVKYRSKDPRQIAEIASMEPTAAIIVDINGDNLLHMMMKNRTWAAADIMAHCDILRLFLRLIPGGAIAVNNHVQTPYDLLKTGYPAYDVARRLLLLAGAPSLHPETRQQMNYQARKGALFAFFAPRGGEHQSGGVGLDICHRIRHGAGAMEIIRQIVSFL